MTGRTKKDDKKKEPVIRYYSLDRILKKNADYNIIFGERSNGKTYACLEYGIKQFVKDGSQMAYIRRWREDIKGKRAGTLFDNLAPRISELTNGEYTEIYYWNNRWFLSNYDSELKKHVPCEKALCYGFALSEMEHDKSTSYPEVRTIIFDEFLTRKYYLPDEFILFMNVLSTIIRNRGDVKIFMLGNTVNKFCPYFGEMGLRHIGDMKQGTIDVYQYGDNKLTVAVEYADSLNKNKPSNKYFAFDNQNLKMISGGKWELAIYPHLSVKYDQKDILFTYFIMFEDNILQCEIVLKDENLFTYIHEKTTPIKDEKHDIIYSLQIKEGNNYRVRLLSRMTKLDTKISSFYLRNKVFYQNNEVGELVRNYIMQSEKAFIKN